MKEWSKPQTNQSQLETQLRYLLFLQMLAKVLDQEWSKNPTQTAPFHPNNSTSV